MVFPAGFVWGARQSYKAHFVKSRFAKVLIFALEECQDSPASSSLGSVGGAAPMKSRIRCHAFM